MNVQCDKDAIYNWPATIQLTGSSYKIQHSDKDARLARLLVRNVDVNSPFKLTDQDIEDQTELEQRQQQRPSSSSSFSFKSFTARCAARKQAT